MKHIIGLGNPGKKYESTRHNVGWLALDVLAKDLGVAKDWKQSVKAQADYIWTTINELKIELVKPTTFMNNSGKTIRYILKKHQSSGPDNFIVVHDDVDIAFGEIKVSKDSGSAGHNGVKSIIEALGTKDFTRVRIGVGKSDTIPTEAFVLQTFTPEEQKELSVILNETKNKIITLFTT